MKPIGPHQCALSCVRKLKSVSILEYCDKDVYLKVTNAPPMIPSKIYHFTRYHWGCICYLQVYVFITVFQNRHTFEFSHTTQGALVGANWFHSYLWNWMHGCSSGLTLNIVRRSNIRSDDGYRL